MVNIRCYLQTRVFTMYIGSSKKQPNKLVITMVIMNRFLTVLNSLSKQYIPKMNALKNMLSINRIIK